jgi:hypothetical protein
MGDEQQMRRKRNSSATHVQPNESICRLVTSCLLFVVQTLVTAGILLHRVCLAFGPEAKFSLSPTTVRSFVHSRGSLSFSSAGSCSCAVLTYSKSYSNPLFWVVLYHKSSCRVFSVVAYVIIRDLIYTHQ